MNASSADRSLTSTAWELEPPRLNVQCEAEQLLCKALERFRRPDGYEGYLVEAAWQLEQIGSEAFPVLEALILSRTPECEYFLGAFVRLAGIAPRRRLPALLATAGSPDANVRGRLLELLEEMQADLRDEVSREL